MPSVRKHTKETYIAALLKKFPDNKNLFSYDNIMFSNLNTKINIFCIACQAVFTQSAKNHLVRGDGCPRCANIIRAATMKAWSVKGGSIGNKIIHNNAKIFNDAQTSFYINKAMWNKYKVRAKQRNLIFEINPQDVFTIFKQQNGLCELTGAKLICDSFNYTKINWSIDRIDNDKGYTADNIMLVTKQANMYRNRSSIKELLEFCNMVSSNRDLTQKYKNMTSEEKAERLKTHSICYAKKKDDKEETSIESTSSDAIV